MRPIFHMLDLPPVWLLAHLALAYLVAVLSPPVFGSLGLWLGGGLIGAGLVLMAVAVGQMVARRTTVIPRRAPAALMTTGVFSLSRNPIYLGDALVLTGAILWWDAALALPLVASFVSLIQARFIRDEEARLTEAFGPQFDLWAARVRRWLGRR